AIGADDNVAAQPQLLDPLDDVIDLPLTGAGLHDDDHGAYLFALVLFLRLCLFLFLLLRVVLSPFLASYALKRSTSTSTSASASARMRKRKRRKRTLIAITFPKNREPR